MKKGFVILLFACILVIAFASIGFPITVGDPFDGNSLQNPNWQWQNEPVEWDVGTTNAGWLHFVPSVNQNLWASDTTARLYQEINMNEFDVETHIVMDYQGGCVVAGIVAYGPTEDNWTTLKVWGRAGDAIIQWQHKQSEVVPNVSGSSQPAGRVEYYIRMAKDGDNYMGWWKAAAADSWIEVKPDAPMALTLPIHLGVFAGICADTGEATVQYEYFKDNIEPTTSVDSTTKLSTTWGNIKY